MVPCKSGLSVVFSNSNKNQCATVRAQGLNNALEDARLYVDAVRNVVYGGQDLESNINAYDESTYTRGSMDIKLSNEQMYAYHHWDAVMSGPLMRGGYKKQQ